MSQKLESIELLRLPLAVLIISIHFPGLPVDENYSGFGLQWMLHAPVGIWFREFISCLSLFAVPVFFVISGYLFYLRGGVFSKNLYIKKLKSRIFTLFVPYIAWNIIRFVCEIPLKGTNQWMMMFLAPANGQFWFVRDLMYLSILSPLIYYFIKKIWWFMPLACFAIAVSGICHWKIHDGILTCSALLYFSLGACLSIKRIDIDILFSRMTKLSFVLLAVFLCYRFVYVFSEVNKTISTLLFIVAIPGLFNGVHLLSNRVKYFLLTFANTSFFIYAAHKLVGMGLQGTFALLGLRNVFYNDYFFAFRILLIATVCVITYYILKLYFPKWIFKILIGSRI